MPFHRKSRQVGFGGRVVEICRDSGIALVLTRNLSSEQALVLEAHVEVRLAPSLADLRVSGWPITGDEGIHHTPLLNNVTKAAFFGTCLLLIRGSTCIV
jgi:hypothetical protein